MTGALILGIVAGLVDVSGQTTCPRPEQVAERVRALLPVAGALPALAAAEHDLALLEISGDVLSIDLRDSSGRSLATRQLPTGAPCADLAGAAAVVIAAWEAELRPAVLPPMPARPPPTVPWRWELDASLLVSLAVTSTGDVLAPGGALEASFGPSTSRFGARIVAVASDRRGEPLVAPGQVRWMRPFVAAGPRWRLASARWQLDLHAEAIAALLVLDGVGYSSSQQVLDFDPGVGVGARTAVRVGPIALSFGVTGIGWLRHQQATVIVTPENVPRSTDLPRFEILLTVGVGAGRY